MCVYTVYVYGTNQKIRENLNSPSQARLRKAKHAWHFTCKHRHKVDILSKLKQQDVMLSICTQPKINFSKNLAQSSLTTINISTKEAILRHSAGHTPCKIKFKTPLLYVCNA